MSWRPARTLRMADRTRLTDLVGRYAEALDRRDVPSLMACFVATGQFEIAGPDGGLVLLTGRPEIEEYMRTRFFSGPDALLAPDVRSTHLMGHPLVTIDRSGAHVRTKAVIYLASERVGVRVRGVEYTDSCVRTRAGWLFAHRRHELQWSGEMPLTALRQAPGTQAPAR